VSSLEKRSTCDKPHSQGSLMPIPAMWKIVHSAHFSAQKEMGDGIPLIPLPGWSGDQELWAYCWVHSPCNVITLVAVNSFAFVIQCFQPVQNAGSPDSLAVLH